MSGIIDGVKNKIKNSLSSRFIRICYDDNMEKSVAKYPKVCVASYGENNPDKMFYVIRRGGCGAGFFSNLTHVLVNLKIAEDLGMIPVVDFENFPTFYNEVEYIHETKNAWEYYFAQTSPYSLKEVYSSKHVFFCDESFPWDYWHNNLRNKDFYKYYYDKYIKLTLETECFLDKYSNLFNAHRVLGIHFRGKEMNYAANHFFSPTLSQMFKYTDDIMGKYKFDKIFLLTEEKMYLDAFVLRYRDKLIYTDSFCIEKLNAYKIYPRKSHKYLLGLEILRDTLLLSRCNSILCSSSNVSETATFLGDYENTFFIYNGKNSKNVFISKILYDIKKRLPASLGGLKNQLIINKTEHF